MVINKSYNSQIRELGWIIYTGSFCGGVAFIGFLIKNDSALWSVFTTGEQALITICNGFVNDLLESNRWIWHLKPWMNPNVISWIKQQLLFAEDFNLNIIVLMCFSNMMSQFLKWSAPFEYVMPSRCYARYC